VEDMGVDNRDEEGYIETSGRRFGVERGHRGEVFLWRQAAVKRTRRLL